MELHLYISCILAVCAHSGGSRFKPKKMSKGHVINFWISTDLYFQKITLRKKNFRGPRKKYIYFCKRNKRPAFFLICTINILFDHELFQDLHILKALKCSQ